jgi:hypothetical protein
VHLRRLDGFIEVQAVGDLLIRRIVRDLQDRGLSKVYPDRSKGIISSTPYFW